MRKKHPIPFIFAPLAHFCGYPLRLLLPALHAETVAAINLLHQLPELNSRHAFHWLALVQGGLKPEGEQDGGEVRIRDFFRAGFIQKRGARFSILGESQEERSFQRRRRDARAEIGRHEITRQ